MKLTVTNNIVNVQLSLQPSSISHTMTLGVPVAGESVTYHGDYEVTSFCADPLMTSSLVLNTAAKFMERNVTIYSVPTSEEYNEHGGVTFTIGG